MVAGESKVRALSSTKLAISLLAEEWCQAVVHVQQKPFFSSLETPKEKELIVQTTLAPFYLESRSARIEGVFSKQTTDYSKEQTMIFCPALIRAPLSIAIIRIQQSAHFLLTKQELQIRHLKSICSYQRAGDSSLFFLISGGQAQTPWDSSSIFFCVF